MAPAVSDRQRKFMQAEYGRKKRGEKTETGMSSSQLRDFASMAVSAKGKPTKGKHHGRPRDKKHAMMKKGKKD